MSMRTYLTRKQERLLCYLVDLLRDKREGIPNTAAERAFRIESLKERFPKLQAEEFYEDLEERVLGGESLIEILEWVKTRGGWQYEERGVRYRAMELGDWLDFWFSKLKSKKGVKKSKQKREVQSLEES